MKKLLSVFLIITITLCLVGCQDSGASKQPCFTFIVDKDNTYDVSFSKGFAQAAEANEVACTILYASTAEEQSAAIEKAVQEGAKAIAIAPVDETSLKSALFKANQANIPVVTVNRPTDGADYFINQADFEVITQTILEDIYELLDGEGQFALVDTNMLGISARPWISYLENLLKTEKYSSLELVEKIFADDERVFEKVENLTTKYPDLKLIYMPNGNYLDEICKRLEDKKSDVRVTGLANPSKMKDLVGDDRVCPFFYLWDSEKIGADAFSVLKAIVDGKLTKEDTVFCPKEGEEYLISKEYLGQKTIYISSIIQFNKNNIDYWCNIY